MTLAYLLAITHHLLVFGLVAVLAAETALVRPGLAADGILRLGRLDGAYGGVALAALAIGLLRAATGLKGWDFYAGNVFFWGKVAAFLLVGLLSIPPTLAYLRWRRALAAGALPDEAAIRRTALWLRRQWVVLATVPLFAAALGLNL